MKCVGAVSRLVLLTLPLWRASVAFTVARPRRSTANRKLIAPGAVSDGSPSTPGGEGGVVSRVVAIGDVHGDMHINRYKNNMHMRSYWMPDIFKTLFMCDHEIAGADVENV